MASPRPVLKRQGSKVRFSRGEMSPVGTMASDSTVHGVHGQHSYMPQPSQQQRQQASGQYTDDEGSVYDGNQYPYSEDISLAPSQDPSMVGNQAYYRQVDHREEEDEQSIHPHDSSSQRFDNSARDLGAPIPPDGYTATPPRVGTTRRATNTAQHRPQLDNLYAGPEASERFNPPPDQRARVEDVSPRGSVVGGYEQQYNQTPNRQPYNVPMNGSPQARPPSAMRSHYQQGAPPRLDSQPRYDQNGQYDQGRDGAYRGSTPARMSQLNVGTQSRRLDPQQQRHSVPDGSPHVNEAQYGSPRSPPQGIRRYPEYEDAAVAHQQRLSAAPPYQSPRNSYGNKTDVFGTPQGGRQDWDNKQPVQPNQYRHDSDATLNGAYNEKEGFENYTMGGGKSYGRPRAMSDDSGRSVAPGRKDEKDSKASMKRRTTREMENDDDDGSSYKVKGGVFSQLLRLTGRSSTLRRRISSRGASSVNGGQDLPTMKSLGLKKVNSTASTVFGADELDPDDPRVTGQKKKKRRNSWSDIPFGKGEDSGLGGKRNRRASIQYHVADILTRQQFILKLAKALMMFGAPSHRIESQLSATALVLEIDAQFIHFPSIVIASFGDIDTRTSETHFVKASGGLDLGKLHKVHNIYKAVVHDELEAGEGSKRIHDLIKAPTLYNVWQRIILAFLCSAIIGPMGFGGSLIDGLASGACGILLSFLQLHVASKSAMYSNIFEISIATVISFAARGLSSTGLFCYQAVSSAGVVLILPGYTILCGSLELASKNIVSGSVRMVYAIIYSLFLGFGITIGSDLFYVIDPSARRAAHEAAAAFSQSVTVKGEFNPYVLISSGVETLVNSTTPLIPFNGTFTFTNNTINQVSRHLNQGSIICERPDGLPWYRQAMPPLYLILTVPLFSFLLSLWNMQPLRSKQLPVMVVISCLGYLTNTLANHYIFDRSDVVSAIGAFVIGVLGNIYSRVFGGTAFTAMVPGVLFLVPSGIAAAGGLAMTEQASGEKYSQGLVIGFRMVQVAIGITVGLFGSGLLIYSFGRKKGAALFAF